MKVDKLCQKCSKPCKQVAPAVVVSCAKFVPQNIQTMKESKQKLTG